MSNPYQDWFDSIRRFIEHDHMFTGETVKMYVLPRMIGTTTKFLRYGLESISQHKQDVVYVTTSSILGNYVQPILVDMVRQSDEFANVNITNQRPLTLSCGDYTMKILSVYDVEVGQLRSFAVSHRKSLLLVDNPGRVAVDTFMTACHHVPFNIKIYAESR